MKGSSGGGGGGRGKRGSGTSTPDPQDSEKKGGTSSPTDRAKKRVFHCPACVLSCVFVSPLSLSLYVFVTGLYHIVLLTLSVRQICVDLCMSWIFCFVKTVKNVISSVDITLKIPGIIHFQIILYLSRQKLFCAEKFEGRICIKFSDDLHKQL